MNGFVTLRTSRRAAGLALAAFLMTACASLGRVPGPEDPAVIGASRGTLLLAESGDGILNYGLLVVDLPSLRRHDARVPGGWDALGGIDDRGRVAYLWRRGSVERELRCFDVISGETETVLSLPTYRSWRISQAPTAGKVALWLDRGTEIEVVDLASGSRHALGAPVGAIQAVNWLPDGLSLALEGPGGSAIVDATSGAVRERSPTRYGTFSPDGDSFLAASGDAFLLVERASGDTLAAPARFPGSVSSPPYGLCGKQLGLYAAIPTEGKSGGWSIARGGSFFREDPVLKVADLVNGTYATLLPREGSFWQVQYSPGRIPALASEYRPFRSTALGSSAASAGGARSLGPFLPRGVTVGPWSGQNPVPR